MDTGNNLKRQWFAIMSRRWPSSFNLHSRKAGCGSIKPEVLVGLHRRQIKHAAQTSSLFCFYFLFLFIFLHPSSRQTLKVISLTYRYQKWPFNDSSECSMCRFKRLQGWTAGNISASTPEVNFENFIKYDKTIKYLCPLSLAVWLIQREKDIPRGKWCLIKTASYTG